MNTDHEQEVALLRHRLHTCEAGFSNVVEHSPDGILITDCSGSILYVNSALETMTGRSKDRLIGQHFGHPILSGDITEIELLSVGGTPVIAEMRVVLTDWMGEPANLATIRDISQRVRLTNDLRQSNIDLESFAKILAHDIRAPLRHLKLLAGWLQNDHSADLNSEAAEDVELIRKSSSRLSRMVDDLLQYSLISARQSMASDVALEDVLMEAINNIRDQQFASDAQIVHDPLPVIDCNVKQMVNLMQNILSNAITHCTVKPKISIRCAQSNAGHIQLSFYDNGIGVEEKYWDKIFEPFNHLLPDELNEGSGIGLATCRKIAVLHEGKIWFKCRAGTGSVVHVQLPVKQLAAMPPDSGNGKPTLARRSETPPETLATYETNAFSQ